METKRVMPGRCEEVSNIVLDFTKGLQDIAQDQPIAIMPAHIAERALQAMVEMLKRSCEKA